MTAANRTETRQDYRVKRHRSRRPGLKRRHYQSETLCAESAPIILEHMEFPEQIIHIAAGADKTKADQEKMRYRALNRLATKNTLLSVSIQTKNPVKPLFPVWVSCTEIIVDRMKREFSVEATSVHLKWLTVKLSAKPLKLNTNTQNNPW